MNYVLYEINILEGIKSLLDFLPVFTLGLIFIFINLQVDNHNKKNKEILIFLKLFKVFLIILSFFALIGNSYKIYNISQLKNVLKEKRYKQVIGKIENLNLKNCWEHKGDSFIIKGVSFNIYNGYYYKKACDGGVINSKLINKNIEIDYIIKEGVNKILRIIKIE